MALSRPKLCIDCGTITINGTRCGDCELSKEAIRRLRRGKTSDRYGAEYQRNRKILLEHAKAEGVSCVLAIEGVCQGRPTTADHKIPISRGGTHDLDNLQPACAPCNSSKRDHIERFFGG